MIRSTSKTRARQNRLYLKARRDFLWVRPWCEVCRKIHRVRLLVRNHSTEVHHRGGKIGEKLLDESLWLPVCRWCHNWIRDNTAKARALGLIAPEGQWNTTGKTKNRRRE